MSIDLSGLPKEIRIAVGERYELLLPSYSGSGNNWSVTSLSGEEVARAWIEPVDVPNVTGSPGNEPPELMLVPDRLVVFGLSPGEATWRLTLARSFGPPTPTATSDLHVTVVNAP